MPITLSRQQLADIYRQSRGFGENALSMLTGGIAEPVAGFASLAALARGENAAGARDAVRDAFTYSPRTAEGQGQQRMLGELAQSAMNSAPVRTWQRGVDFAGRASPVAGATLQTVPAALGALTGYKQAMQTGNALSQRLAQAQRAAMDNAMRPRVLHPQRGVFAGINAKTADLDKLDSARKMLTDGVPASEVLAKTGWTIGADGRWRFEIDDSASYMRGKKAFLGAPVRSDLSMGDLAGSGVDMQDVLQHQALFDAYPELRKANVSAARFADRGGDYSPGDGSIRIADNLSGDSARSVMLHEIQHAIQEKEGFQGGGSANDFMGVNANDLLMKKAAAEARINEINSRLRSAKGDEYMALLDERRALIPDAQIDDLDILENAHSKYMRLMGETEARNVQARMNMGREDRMRTPPINTEDRARNSQIRQIFRSWPND
jgi:hypothetical protein